MDARQELQARAPIEGLPMTQKRPWVWESDALETLAAEREKRNPVIDLAQG